MDIAIFKWFIQSPAYKVTIGRSVDCSLQLSRDIESDIAPVQAEIVKHRGCCYIVAVEEGIRFEGKALAAGRRKRLYHGSRFCIGDTTLTYIEK